jgi:exosortase/archaeosortase family protein
MNPFGQPAVAQALDAVWHWIGSAEARGAARWLAAWGEGVTVDGASIRHASGPEFLVEAACTVVWPLALLTIGLFALRWARRPPPLAWRLALALPAAGLLVVLNGLRMASLIWIEVHRPAWLDLAHHGIWPALLCLAALALPALLLHRPVGAVKARRVDAAWG